jgi:hypothetical protein
MFYKLYIIFPTYLCTYLFTRSMFYKLLNVFFYLFIYPFTYMANVLQATNCLTYLPTYLLTWPMFLQATDCPSYLSTYHT